MRLWYDREACIWEEALPIGNGRLGAMIWGGANEEHLSLNEDTLWSGEVRDKLKKNAYQYLDEIRDKVSAGEIAEAQELLEKHYFGEWTESYLPLGDLRIRMKHGAKISNYERELTLDHGIATVHYQADGVNYRREMFVSYVDDVIAIRLDADKAGAVHCELSLSSPLIYSVKNSEKGIVLDGQAPYYAEPSYTNMPYNPLFYEDGRGMRFGAFVTVAPNGGRMERYGSSCAVIGADSLVIYVACGTSFHGFDKNPFTEGKNYKRICEDSLRRAELKGYECIKRDHIEDFGELYRRVSISLGKSADNLPVNKRLDALKTIQGVSSSKTNSTGVEKDYIALKRAEEDSGLFALMFQYGRYLLISSSRRGTQPANLQGIWNWRARPPWSCNLTTNINTEMNYWHAESCNLAECHEPLFEAIREMSITGEKTAAALYHCRGFVVHHNVDIWRSTIPVSGDCRHSIWPMAGGWLCRHLWEHYLHSMDEKFLRDEAYPLMKKAAEFFLDFMVEDEEGYLVTNPSVSPENVFVLDTKTFSVSTSCTMDISIIKDLFGACISACGILRIDTGFCETLKTALERLRPYKLGRHGQLQEWDNDYEEKEPGHRHQSHLYGLYPGCDITEGQWLKAAEKALERRLENGGGHTGWSCAWLISLFARFQNRERVLQFIMTLLQKSTYPNLFDAHPPFQIDGNFGFSAGIVEMLMQSHKGYIHILPALPELFADGYICGIVARGAFVLDIHWKNGQCIGVSVFSKAGGRCRLQYERCMLEFDTEKDGKYRVEVDSAKQLILK